MAKAAPKLVGVDTLFDLVNANCSNPQILDILRKAKEINKNVRVSGQNKPELLSHLRDALTLKAAAYDDLYEAVCEADEAGHQLIRLYKAKSEAVRDRCNDGAGVARILFGEDWQRTCGFPKFNHGLKGEAWADFRIVELDARGSDWTAKLDAGITRKINPKERIEDRAEGKKSIIEHDLVPAQESYLIKWHHHGLLELRTPIGDSKEHRLDALGRVEAVMQKVFTLGSDFDALDLRPALTKIRQQIDSPGGSDLFSWVNLEIDDPVEGTAFLKTRDKDGNLLRGESRKKFFDSYKECNKAAITWNFDVVNVVNKQKKAVLTHIGSYGQNSVHIRANSSAKAVSYVVDQLRRLA